jgi:uncharacterized membrane protein YcaP (DUF421 family)
MHAFEIHLEDWKRILFGNMPAIFYLEVFLRVTFIYLLILICLRLMGKRMASQLSRNEILALSALAASIGIPLQTPERGMLPAVIVALVVVAGQRIISIVSTQNQKIEQQSQGDISILINDCCLQYKNMEQTRIAKERIFAQLRSEGIKHLGEVKRMYFEASGDFSFVMNKDATPGLSIIPEEDSDYAKRQQKVTNVQVCNKCGKKKEAATVQCDNCGNEQFVSAVL